MKINHQKISCDKKYAERELIVSHAKNRYSLKYKNTAGIIPSKKEIQIYNIDI